MKKPNEIKQFSDWSREWKDGRNKPDAEKILCLWKNKPIPHGWERNTWKGEVGYRKSGDGKGEQCTERQLFNGGEDGFNLVFSDPKTNATYRLQAIYHNMPLANQRKGQVLADVFGFLEMGKSIRPVFIEIKVTANDPWFALVENLQQIRLARAGARNIQDFVRKKKERQVDRGVWGLILAPKCYYEKHSANLAECKPLLDALKQKTRARVAFGISDYLSSGKIEIKDSNWLNNG